MKLIRKALILIHRYLGIVFSLVFFTWFVSGIAMIYTRGMPDLTQQMRLERLPDLDAARIRLSPAQAFKAAALGDAPQAAELVSILNRPAYRFSGSGKVTVFADDGELLEMNSERTAEAARLFMNLPDTKVHPAGILSAVDQWTLGERRSLPLHKFIVDDSSGTELYVSETSGEVAVMTTRSGRMLAWCAAIPHWMYIRALRTRPQVWRQVVLWVSGLATISAVIGLVLAVLQYRRKAPHIPYAGWLRWHYITGLVFGVFTVTWVFSGFLSMEPWFWASDGGLGQGMEESLRGGELDLARFRIPFPLSDGAKEVEFLNIQGEPYYRIQKTDPHPVIVSAVSLQARDEPFSTESLLERIKAPIPEVEVLEATLLEDYDSYYYAFGRQAPLPVLRVKFNDPDSTWLYVDPRMSEIVGRAHRRERLQRWIYHGLHSLDFSFWYYKRPVWDIAMIGLSLGGIALSLIGIVIAWRRVTRALLRIKG